MPLNQKRIRPINAYCAIASVSLLTSLFYILFSGNGTAVLDWLVLGTSNDWELADFFRHIGYSSNLKHTYYVSNDACFPPLAYLFFHLLYLLNPIPEEISADNWQAYAIFPYEILLFVFCAMITSFLFYEAIRRSVYCKPLVITTLLLLSAPSFIAIERGNPIFPVTVMLLWALHLRDQEEKWKRELALVLIAVAAGFKIYPAILGLLYIKEKRYREMRRLLLYGVILFFVPFAFTGGLSGLQQFIKVLRDGHYNASFMKEWSSVRGLCRSVLTKIGLSDSSSVLVGTAAENIFLVVSVFFAFLSDKKWKTILYLTAPMSFYMPTSWCYNMVFYLLPFVMFLHECSACSTSPTASEQLYESRTKSLNTLVLVLYSAIFSVPIWGLFSSITKLICAPGYILWSLLIINDCYKLISNQNRQLTVP